MLNYQDLQRGIDYTGIPLPNGGDLNNGIDLTIPALGGQADVNQGVGFLITTTDTAANTPSVPDPRTSVSYNKWARYMWVRRPFAGQDPRCIRYTWNVNAGVLDPVLLYWVTDFIDTTTLENEINNAVASANNAQTQAQAANSTAASALSTANTAQQTASNVSDTANTALTNANNAQTSANTAQATANAAQATATAAQTQANTTSALPILNAPNTVFDIPMVKFDGSAIIWDQIGRLFAMFSERQNKGTDAGGATIGKNTRNINTTDFAGSVQNIAFLAGGGVIQLNYAGTYRIRAKAPAYWAGGTQSHQLVIANNVSDASLAYGSSVVAASAGTTWSEVDTTLLIAAPTFIRLDHYVSNTVNTNGLGKAANVNPDAGGQEVYSTIEVFYL